MFGQTESNAFPGIDCFGRIYWFGDVLLIVSSHVETGCKKQPVFAVFPVEFCCVSLRFEQFQNCRVAG